MTQTEKILDAMSGGRYGMREAIELVTNNSAERKEIPMFFVEFSGQSLYTYIVRVAPPDGLEALDVARTALGAQITYVKCPKSGVNRREVMCDVTEAQARKACSSSGAFGKSRQATVTVPSEALNRWASFSWRCLPGNVTIAECVPSLDYKRVVEAWLSDGAPLEWTPSGYEPMASSEEDGTDNQ